MRRLVLLAVVLGLGALLVAGFLGRHHLLERWYLAKLESDDPAWVLTATARLAEIRSSRAVPVLAYRLRRVGDEEKKPILEAFAVMGPHAAEAAPALVKLLDDRAGRRDPEPPRLPRAGALRPEDGGDRWVEGLALRALEAIGPAAFPAILQEVVNDQLRMPEGRIHWRIFYFTATHEWSARYLVDQLGSEYARRSVLTKRILREIGPPIVPWLTGLWASADPLLQSWAADLVWDLAMDRLRSGEKAPAGIAALIDPALQGDALSGAAVSLVTQLMDLDDRSREALSRLWPERDFDDLRAHSIRAVARDVDTGVPSIPHFCTWLSSEKVTLRSAAFDALSALGPGTIPEPDSAQEDGGPVIAGLLRVLGSQNERGKRWAHLILVELGLKSRGAVTAMENALGRAGPLERPRIEEVLRRVKRTMDK